MKEELLILVTNDDSIVAPGLKALVEAVRPYGKIVVVAPDSPQSGQGHAITLEEPLRLVQVDVFDGIEAYQCSGTPVDCVKIANNVILERKPDICVSGVNHGANSSINIIYSGTMSAAVEAYMEGITAIGFSNLNYRFDADFSACKHYAKQIVEKIIAGEIEKGTLLNVNIPDLPLEEIKGLKVCRQGKARWDEEFDKREDPRKRQYYWLKGKFESLEDNSDTDIWALENGYVSVVPCHADLTNYKMLDRMKENFDG